MAQYCCRLDESTLLEMNDLGGGVYQCPKCMSLRIWKDGFARPISHDEAAELLKNNGSGLGGVVLGGLALLALATALSK